MTSMAPNVCALVGSRITAKLLALTGGLTAMSKTPSCNLQVCICACMRVYAFVCACMHLYVRVCAFYVTRWVWVYVWGCVDVDGRMYTGVYGCMGVCACCSVGVMCVFCYGG